MIKVSTLISKLFFSLKTQGPLWTLFFSHVVSCGIIFAHFWIYKYYYLVKIFPLYTTNYNFKVYYIPTFIALKHLILYQMALIPLTMCRYSVTVLRATKLKRYIAFDYLVHSHIYLGYLLGGLIVVATGLLFFADGFMCTKYNNGDEYVNYCEKFTQEIMITGYVLGVIFIAIFVTSCPIFFHRCKWFQFEHFYSVHHLFIAFYALSIAHCIDDLHRNGIRNRAQAYWWIVGPLVYYALDRFMYIMTRKDTFLLRTKMYENPKSMTLTLKRPDGFGFRSGQYLFLNVPEISKLQWHPFSIASTNNDNTLELFIKIIEGGWTERLFDLQKNRLGDENGPVKMMIMGPYGSSSQDISSFNQVTLIGGGSGIVPLISVLNQYISDVLIES